MVPGLGGALASQQATARARHCSLSKDVIASLRPHTARV